MTLTVQLTPFLFMDGNAKEAISFYEEALCAHLLFSQTYGDAPDDSESPLPANMKELVAHAVVKIGEAKIMIADMFPGKPHRSGNQVTICISTDDLETAKRFYESLKHEGLVEMPLQSTHFSPGYAMVTDKFGVTFQIFTASSEEAVKRGHQKDI
jgi:PhnB protein